MKWLILDDSSSDVFSSMTISQIVAELSKTEDKVSVANTFENKCAVTNIAVKQLIHQLEPDVILFQGATGLRYFDELNSYDCKRINLWFDDPLLRVSAYNVKQQFQDSFLAFDHFIWDGYWRDVVMKKFGVPSQPIHLAADPKQFFPASTIFNYEDMAFIGNLHSPRQIEVIYEGLPPTFQRIIRFAKDYLLKIGDGDVPSWDKIIKAGYEDCTEGEQNLIRVQGERNSEVRSNFHWSVWAMSKNHVRVRMLKRALKFGKIRMFAETGPQQNHANESETRALIGEWTSRLSFHSTFGYNTGDLSELYHHGWIQLQATDPQSVQGGLPYRVFQTAASARPLLTDKKPELGEQFEYGKELLTYDGMDDIESKLEDAYKNRSSLEDIGTAARKRFEMDHTWEHRINYIKSQIGIGFQIDLNNLARKLMPLPR
jgi:glycosyltransferase involved in cell wall biosynthesis